MSGVTLGRPTGSNVQWVWSGTDWRLLPYGAGGENNAQYLLMSGTASLPNERTVKAGTGIFIIDGGPSQHVTFSIDDNVVATISGSTFAGAVKFVAGLSGSLTTLVDGSSYLVAGPNVTIASSSNGQIVISATTGSGGGSANVTGTWRDPGNTFVTTGSVSIDTDNRTAATIGSDVFFFVSGTLILSGTSGSNLRKRSVFGGDVVISGALYFNTGGIRIENFSLNASSSAIRFISGTNPHPSFEISSDTSGSIFSVASVVDAPIIEILSDHHTRFSSSIYVGNDAYGRKNYFYISGTRDLTGSFERKFVVDGDSFFSGSFRVSRTEQNIPVITPFFVSGWKDNATVSTQSFNGGKAVFDSDVVVSGTVYFNTGNVGIHGRILSNSNSQLSQIIFTRGPVDMLENHFFEVNDSTSGSLLAITDVSGSPIFEVRSDLSSRVSGTFYMGTDGIHKVVRYFYVSGTRNVTGSNERVAVFDGDARISGTLVVGTGSVTIDSNEVRWSSTTKIFSRSVDLMFQDGIGTNSLNSLRNRADPSGSFVLIGATSSLPNARVIQAGSGITVTDSGPGGAVTIIASPAFGVATTTLSTVTVASSTFYVPIVNEWENAPTSLPITAAFVPDVVAIDRKYWFYHLTPDIGTGVPSPPKTILTSSFDSPGNIGIASSSIPTSGVPSASEDFLATFVIDDFVYIIASGSAYYAPTSTPNILTASTCNLPTKPNRSVAIVGDRVWNFGGADASSTATNKIYSASVSNPLLGWSDTGAVLPVNRRHGSLLVHDGYIYIFGGRDELNNTHASILRAPVSNPLSWSNLGNLLPSAIAYNNVVLVDQYAYLLGGFGAAATSVVWKASLSNLTNWEQSSSNGALPNVRYAGACVVGNDGRLYYIGGSSGVSPFVQSTIFRTRTSLTCSSDSPYTWQAIDPLLGKTINGKVAFASQMQRAGMLPQNYDLTAQSTGSFGTISFSYPSQWIDVGNHLISTGTVSVDSLIRSQSQIGNDVFFFVSGTRGLTGSNAKFALFEGDVRTSGSFLFQTGSRLVDLSRGRYDSLPLNVGTQNSEMGSGSKFALGMVRYDPVKYPYAEANRIWFRAIFACSTASSLAYMELADYSGFINVNSIPGPIEGTQLTGAVGVTYRYYERDITSIFTAVTGAGIVEALMWCDPTGSNRENVCKQASIDIEW